MEDFTLYGENKTSKSLTTYLGWLKDNPSHHLERVVKIATRYYQPSLELEDLISEGNLAYLIALKEYDTKGIKVSINSYINRRVKDQIKNFIKYYHATYLSEHERVYIHDFDLMPCKNKNILNKLEIKDEGQTFLKAIHQVDLYRPRVMHRNWNLFKMVYGIGYRYPLSPSDAGQQYGITEERVKQITARMLVAVGRRLTNWSNFDPETRRFIKQKKINISLHGFRWAVNSFYHEDIKSQDEHSQEPEVINNSSNSAFEPAFDKNTLSIKTRVMAFFKTFIRVPSIAYDYRTPKSSLESIK